MLVELTRPVANEMDLLFIDNKDQLVMVLVYDESVEDFVPKHPDVFFDDIGFDEDEVKYLVERKNADIFYYNGWRGVVIEH